MQWIILHIWFTMVHIKSSLIIVNAATREGGMGQIEEIIAYKRSSHSSIHPASFYSCFDIEILFNVVVPKALKMNQPQTLKRGPIFRLVDEKYACTCKTLSLSWWNTCSMTSHAKQLILNTTSIIVYLYTLHFRRRNTPGLQRRPMWNRVYVCRTSQASAVRCKTTFDALLQGKLITPLPTTYELVCEKTRCQCRWGVS